MYIPHPADTSMVVLPDDLVALTEVISENVHEVWAAGRVRNGWKYGPVRDDEKKETPCIVPYAELSEEEKSYDRNSAMETIKLVIALGYRIEK